MHIEDLGLIPYRQAWAHQERLHEQVLAGTQERLLLLEHPPVITLGRRPGLNQHLLASSDYLQSLGVEVVESDRGGDITFHGPGQLVAYSIIRLADHGLSVSAYVHKLEQIAIATLADFGIEAGVDPKAVGVWSDDNGTPAKICAIGVRIRRGVSLHGLALNVTTDLRYFELIVPCGLHGRAVTSIQKLLGDRAPSMEQVKERLESHFHTAFRPAPAVTSLRK